MSGDASAARNADTDERPVEIFYRPPCHTKNQAFAGHPLSVIVATLAATLQRPADQLTAKPEDEPAEGERRDRPPRCWIVAAQVPAPIAQVRGLAADVVNSTLAALAGASSQGVAA